MKKIVLIIPTYNESGNILALLTELRSLVPEAHILVVDDNSPDGTADEVRTYSAEDAQVSLLFRAQKEGLGKAYLHAFREVLSDPGVDYIVMMDADFSHDPHYLPELIAASVRADVVIASRYCKGGDSEGWEQWRKFMSIIANIYCRSITGLPIHDITGGFNLISTRVLRAISLNAIDASGYAFQMELKYLLWKQGARIIELPIIFKRRREGESKLTNHIIAEGIIAPWKMRFSMRK